MTDIVPVQHEGAAQGSVECFLHGVRDGRLAGARQAGKPDYGAAVAVEPLAPLASDRCVMPDYVGAFQFLQLSEPDSNDVPR